MHTECQRGLRQGREVLAHGLCDGLGLDVANRYDVELCCGGIRKQEEFVQVQAQPQFRFRNRDTEDGQ